VSYEKEEANRLDAIDVLVRVIELAEQAKYQLAEYNTTKETNLPQLVKLTKQASDLANEFASLKDAREHKKYLEEHFKIIMVS
jgi:hypothetical protein